MKNVYDQIRSFYDDEVSWEPAVKREWVEGFFRQKAWQGASDAQLRELWRKLQMFILYLQYSDHDDLETISYPEYSLAIEWLSVHYPDYKVTLPEARLFFDTLIDFYRYLAGKKIIGDLAELEHAAQEIAGGEKLKLIDNSIVEGELGLLSNKLNQETDNISAIPSNDLGRIVSDTVERLMIKLGAYFQQEDFSNDFDRALYLYTGPFNNIPEDEQDEFWLGFWDYFLFDYHLMNNDITPLAHFNATQSERLTSDERKILQDLLSARFAVFYINRVVNQDWVECVNLFTDEKFEMPFFDFDLKTLKKLLFFGHIFFQGVVMINYVTSIEVSINLRRRIKEEVIRQNAVFAIQQPDATLQDFFSRHALVVRHTIDVLVTLAKVNVTPTSQLERVFPLIEENNPPNKEVVALLDKITPEYGYSLHDTKLVQKIWHDYCQLTNVIVRKPAIWAAAVLYAYSQINYTNNIAVEEMADSLGISTASIYSNRSKLYKILKLQPFDPRYLSEEGFVISLFMT